MNLSRRFSFISETRRGAWLIVGLAIAIRLSWALNGHLDPLGSELQRVAVTLSQTGWIADAYRDGSGPTTHVGAIAPALPAFAYWLLGPGSPEAEILLTCIAAVVIATGALAMNALFRELGASPASRALALIVICLIPLNISLEAQELRARETAWSVLGLTLILLTLVRMDRTRQAIRPRQAVGLTFGAASLFLLSPAAALGAYSAMGIFAWRRVSWKQWPGLMGLTALMAVALSAPWALRNRTVFGETIWSRGNFGIEFALGTHAAAVNPADPAANFRRRLAEIHPFRSDQGFNRMVSAGGELPYSKKLARESWAWVAENKAGAIKIWLRHLVEFYAPPAWLWNPYDAVKPQHRVQAFILGLTSLLAMLAAGWQLYRRRYAYLYVIVPVVVVALPYLLAQPRLRYRYLVAGLLVFMATEAIMQAIGRLGWRAKPWRASWEPSPLLAPLARPQRSPQRRLPPSPPA